MTKRLSVEQYEDAIEELGIKISAAEQWAKTYRRNRKSFEKLLRQEARMERLLRRYFRELAQRVPTYIKTDQYRKQAIQAFDVEVIIDTEAFKGETGLLVSALMDETAASIALGANAGEVIYQQALGISQSDAAVLRAARREVARLVRQVNNTTRERIRQSIATSLEVGEPLSEAIDRLQDVVNDPRRAETIARTEIVNSYQVGQEEYALEAGATGKRWINVGAIDVCATNSDEGIIPITETFGSGHKKPAAHPNCRCDIQYIFPEGEGL